MTSADLLHYWGGPSPTPCDRRQHIQQRNHRHQMIARGSSMHEQEPEHVFGDVGLAPDYYSLKNHDEAGYNSSSGGRASGEQHIIVNNGDHRSRPSTGSHYSRCSRDSPIRGALGEGTSSSKRQSLPPTDLELGDSGIRRSQSCGPRERVSGGLLSRSKHLPVSSDMSPGAAKLNLYHVRRPEPRARWVFNLSHGTDKHGKRISESASSMLTRVTSTVDESRPSLGGLVWINATLGGHCCLEKGTKSKIVTDVPNTVLDGWLNGQKGYWWIGALKEGHRTMWDSHVVMAWAMVFIPSFPELAAKNNMEVWRDKCLRGSLRVARPGELARKIADIVADDEDAEPESVVHTHLCILLAEGDNLDLKRPRMLGTTSRDGSKPGAFLTTGGGSVDVQRALAATKSVGNMDTTGGAAPRSRELTGRASSFPGSGDLASGTGLMERDVGNMSYEEALERVERYRDRIRALKDDRQAKKSTIARLGEDLRHKEDLFAAESDRLRKERNDLRTRAKLLRMDLEDLKRETVPAISADHAEQLQFDVERLRRERDDARAEAMRWLEQEKSKLEAAAQEAALADHTQRSLSSGGGSGSIHAASNGHHEGGKRDNASKAAAAIAKLRAKVERLRKERDEAEEQAAKWLNEQQAKLKKQLAAAAAEDLQSGDGDVLDVATDGKAPKVGPGQEGGAGLVVASLKAESLKLREELEASRQEAKMLKERVAVSRDLGELSKVTSVSGLENVGGFAGLSLSKESAEYSADPEEASAQAKKALGQLLGKALNLLSPKAAAEAAAEVAAKAAANAEAAACAAEQSSAIVENGQVLKVAYGGGVESRDVEGWGQTAQMDRQRQEGEDTSSASSTVNNSPPATTAVAAQTPRGTV